MTKAIVISRNEVQRQQVLEFVMHLVVAHKFSKFSIDETKRRFVFPFTGTKTSWELIVR